jgi:hypothetical protein
LVSPCRVSFEGSSLSPWASVSSSPGRRALGAVTTRRSAAPANGLAAARRTPVSRSPKRSAVSL